jgi:hypothetical protein
MNAPCQVSLITVDGPVWNGVLTMPDGFKLKCWGLIRAKIVWDAGDPATGQPGMYKAGPPEASSLYHHNILPDSRIITLNDVERRTLNRAIAELFDEAAYLEAYAPTEGDLHEKD